MSMSSKAATLLWYLQRPSLYGELMRGVVDLRLSTRGRTDRARREKLEGQARCERQVVSPERFFEAIGLPGPIASLESLHGAEWAAAHEAVAACPVKMGGAANLEVLYHLCQRLGAEKVIETGVANGWSTLAVLQIGRAHV